MSETNMPVETGRKPTLPEALIVLAIAAALMYLSVVVWETDIHIAMIIAATIAALVGMFVLKYKWKVIEEGIYASIMMGMQAMIILFAVGTLVGTWLQSGVVQSMIYYGLSILNPSIFLIAALLMCSVVSLATGTSWGTTGTIGIALMGIAAGLEIPPAIAAGFIVSGAYFGDKMSPLSDTTNLAPAMAGADIFQHIRAMIWTTGPTYIIVLILGGILGARYTSGLIDAERVRAIQEVMVADPAYSISLICLIPPILVIALAASGKPALPSIFTGALAGLALGIFQGTPFGQMFEVMQNGFVPEFTTGIAELAKDNAGLLAFMGENGLGNFSAESISNAAEILNNLLERGGLQSMTWTNSLIMMALLFGGILDKCGFLEVFLKAILTKVRTVGGYVLAVNVSCLITNAFAPDQYVAIVIPGRMFKTAFDDMGLHPRMLSRSLEDSGTLTSALVPWNTCGAYQAATLGVSVLHYAPYAFFNYLNAIISIAMTYMGIGITWRGKEGEPIVAKVKPEDI